jgi:hypothetical protein
MRARARFTQTGQSESVVRGQPSGGDDFSQLFNSGPVAQGAWNNDRTRKRRVAAIPTVHATFAAFVITASRAFVITITACLLGSMSPGAAVL